MYKVIDVINSNIWLPNYFQLLTRANRNSTSELKLSRNALTDNSYITNGNC